MNEKNHHFITSLRQASPYLLKHRDKTIVVLLPIQEQYDFSQIVQDLLFLKRSLIKVILLPYLEESHAPTDSERLAIIIEQQNQFWQRIQTYWLRYSNNVDIVQTQIVKVQSIGVINGVDWECAGKPNGVYRHKVNQLLQQNWLVFQPITAFSASGQLLAMDCLALCQQICADIPVNKLVYLGNIEGVNKIQQQQHSLTLQQAMNYCQSSDFGDAHKLLGLGVSACQVGVNRVHFLDVGVDGTLLSELFTQDGQGLLIYNDGYDNIKQADESSISGILNLLDLVGQDSLLVTRSKNFLDSSYHNFFVLERDSNIIGCVAVLPLAASFEVHVSCAELACFAIHPDYRSQGFGERLLSCAINLAKTQEYHELFALTTQAKSWFYRHGFVSAQLNELPMNRQGDYSLQRNSYILKYSLK